MTIPNPRKIRFIEDALSNIMIIQLFDNISFEERIEIDSIIDFLIQQKQKINNEAD